jgi:hypothetical protein
MPKTEGGLFDALEEVLKQSTDPFTCVELYELPKIRKLAESSNRVSDYLGGLWRKGLVLRHPAPRSSNSSARWMYSWKPQPEGRKTAQVFEYVPAPKNTSGVSLLKKPNIEITDNGDVITIDLPQMTITIRPKS